MGVSVFRRVQEGYHGEPAITRERKHFRKICPSDCKSSTCLACSYLNWHEEVSAALCSAVDRMNERTNDKTTTVTLRPRVNNWFLLVLLVSMLGFQRVTRNAWQNDRQTVSLRVAIDDATRNTLDHSSMKIYNLIDQLQGSISRIFMSDGTIKSGRALCEDARVT